MGQLVGTAERASTEGVEKYPRGKNPRSLANLKPFPPGVSGNPGAPHVGPMLTPALRRFIGMTVGQLKEMAKHPEKLSAAEAIALTTILDALTTGSFSTGAKSRDLMFRRLDGDEDKKGDTFNVDKMVLVRYVE